MRFCSVPILFSYSLEDGEHYKNATKTKQWLKRTYDDFIYQRRGYFDSHITLNVYCCNDDTQYVVALYFAFLDGLV